MFHKTKKVIRFGTRSELVNYDRIFSFVQRCCIHTISVWFNVVLAFLSLWAWVPIGLITLKQSQLNVPQISLLHSVLQCFLEAFTACIWMCFILSFFRSIGYLGLQTAQDSGPQLGPEAWSSFRHCLFIVYRLSPETNKQRSIRSFPWPFPAVPTEHHYPAFIRFQLIYTGWVNTQPHTVTHLKCTTHMHTLPVSWISCIYLYKYSPVRESESWIGLLGKEGSF